MNQQTFFQNERGKIGEKLAKLWLEKRGYIICGSAGVWSPGGSKLSEIKREHLFETTNRSNSRLIEELSICEHIGCEKTAERIHVSQSKSTNFVRVTVKSCDEVCGNYRCLFFKTVEAVEKAKYGGALFADFIAHKDGVNYLIEVKTDRAKLKTLQGKFLKKMRELGYIPLLLRTQVKVDASVTSLNEIK